MAGVGPSAAPPQTRWRLKREGCLPWPWHDEPVRVAALWVYPVKGCAGIEVHRWPVDARGLRYDRDFMVVDDDGDFLSQRTHPPLAVVTPTFTDDGRLAITTPGGSVTVQLPILPSSPSTQHDAAEPPDHERGVPRMTEVWGFRATADDAGDAAAELLSDHLGQSVRLVRVPPGYPRRADPDVAGAGVPVSFSDGYPLLVTNEASLESLNGWLDEPLPMNRFRPNLVIADVPAFAEDAWPRLRIGDIDIDLVSPCTRCAVTTIDQATGARDGPEPLRSLAKFRRGREGVEFGWNAVARGSGTLSVQEAAQWLMMDHDRHR